MLPPLYMKQSIDVPCDTTPQKRARVAEPSLDPCIWDLIHNYNAANTSSEHVIAITNYLKNKAASSWVVLDIETTELIQKETPIDKMTPSVTCALLIDAHVLNKPELSFSEIMKYYAAKLNFWPEETLRGTPYEFLMSILDMAVGIVAYNGAHFDLPVLAGHNKIRLHMWMQKLWDPMVRLRHETGHRFSLAQLLSKNGIDPKSGKGSEAPAQWKRGLANRNDPRPWDELDDYCMRDVVALAEVVLMDKIAMPNSKELTFNASIRIDTPFQFPPRSLFPTFGLDAPQSLVQLSSEWHSFRRGKVGASLAAGLLGISPYTNPNGAFRQLMGVEQVNETQAMRRGREEEVHIALSYAVRFGAALCETGSWPHPVKEWFLSSPDRLVINPDGGFGILECKSTNKLQQRVPLHYLLQVLLQLACVPDAQFADLIEQEYTDPSQDKERTYATMRSKRPTTRVTRVRKSEELALVCEFALGQIHNVTRHGPTNEAEVLHELKERINNVRSFRVIALW